MKYVQEDIIRARMIAFGFKSADMTVTEFVDDLPAANVKPTENYLTEPPQPCVMPWAQYMPTVEAMAQIRSAIKENDNSLVSIEALKTIEKNVKDLIELYIKAEHSLCIALYFGESNETNCDCYNKGDRK